MPLPNWLKNYIITTVIGLGNTLAVVISWSAHRSVGWGIFDGLLGWLYVGYHLLTGRT